MSDEDKNRLVKSLSDSTLQQVWSDLVSSSNPQSLRLLATHLVSEASSTMASGGFKLEPGVVGTLTEALKNLAATSNLRGQDNVLRRGIYQHFLDDGDYKEAANVLAGLRIDDEEGSDAPYSFTRCVQMLRDEF